MARKFLDAAFEILLKKEFQKDLHSIAFIDELLPWERTEPQKELLEFMQEKYQINGDCPSPCYNSVSKELQNKYKTIHNRIYSYFDASKN